MTKQKDKLPAKPSALIRLALADLYKVEKDKRYEVDMSLWHDSTYSEVLCQVCFAGSVMAKTLGAQRNRDVYPDSFGHNTEKKLYALDDFRQGEIDSGLGYMGFNLPGKMHGQRGIVDYMHSPNEFKHKMRRLASDLANKGL